jgi:hypothetical protein
MELRTRLNSLNLSAIILWRVSGKNGDNAQSE